MKLTKLQIVGIAFATASIIMAVVCTAMAYKYITIRNEHRENYDDKIIYTFGKKNLTYFAGGMDGDGRKDPNKHKGDKFSKIYFDVQLKPNGTMVLYDINRNNSSDVVGIYITTRLNASTHYQNGKYLQREYDDMINNAIFNNIREGSQYGLDRYVRYMKKDGNRLADFDEVLLAMKDDSIPLRILEVDSPPSVRPHGGGGVYHYFMYNDLVQVKMHYQKYYLKDWQFIENSMIAYLDQLYKEAEQ